MTHDIKKIRENPQEFDRQLARRGHPPIAQEILALDAKKRESLHELQALQDEVNKNQKEVTRIRILQKKFEDTLASPTTTWETAKDLMIEIGWHPQDVQLQIDNQMPWPLCITINNVKDMFKHE